MPRVLVLIVAGVVLLFPTNGNAQSDRAPEPPPQVTAVNADWQIRGEPIFFASNFYWPAGPDIFFDPAVMVRTGQYEGIPLYVNQFLPAYSVVYVPIGGGILRPYILSAPEAGRVGSAGAPPPHMRLPSVPPAIVATAPAAAAGPVVVAPVETGPRPVGTAGVAAATPRSRTTISTPPLGSRNGIWLTFNGNRYYNAGPAVPFSSERFVPIGAHRGFPVYRDRVGNGDLIYVAAVQDGPLAPYRK
jgi:hypothetical protein